MSSPRRARSASVESTCSRRFFSRITCCDLCGFDQRFGSAACFSISASWGRSFAGSKILPQFVHFLAYFFEFLLEFLIHEGDSAFFRNAKRATSAANEIIAHANANQSPWREYESASGVQAVHAHRAS